MLFLMFLCFLMDWTVFWVVAFVGAFKWRALGCIRIYSFWQPGLQLRFSGFSRPKNDKHLWKWAHQKKKKKKKTLTNQQASNNKICLPLTASFTWIWISDVEARHGRQGGISVPPRLSKREHLLTYFHHNFGLQVWQVCWAILIISRFQVCETFHVSHLFLQLFCFRWSNAWPSHLLASENSPGTESNSVRGMRLKESQRDVGPLNKKWTKSEPVRKPWDLSSLWTWMLLVSEGFSKKHQTEHWEHQKAVEKNELWVFHQAVLLLLGMEALIKATSPWIRWGMLP